MNHHEEPCCTGSVQAVADVLKQHNRRPESLLQILIELQQRLNWLPPEVLTETANALSLSRAQVEGVAGFYSFLHTEPVGRYRVLFADNIIEQHQGSRQLMAQLCQSLWLQPGKLSEDGLVSVDTTSCIGMGDQGPAMLVNNQVVTRLTPERIDQIAALIRQQVPLAQWPHQYFQVDNTIHRADALLNSNLQPGQALNKAIALGADGLMHQMQQWGWRGRGGAGFSTATKWGICRHAAVKAERQRVVVCNADEGEPGTFKDRLLLTDYADLVFEGMSLAALVAGADQGFLYLRGEYRYLLPHLEQVLERRRSSNLLGKNILGLAGFDFDIAIHLGAGAYICGEESALIESLEGKRGTPRIRPPFPVTSGYLGRPTCVNNVETLVKACLIAAQGGEAFSHIGTAKSTGTKLLSISGDCAVPGLYEFPFGVTIREVLDACGAIDTQAVQVGGASGVTLAPAEFGRRIAFEDVPSAGAFMIFNHSRDMFQVASNFVHFFAHESCGFCTPCRVGTTLLCSYMDKLEHGHGSRLDLAEIEGLNQLLKSTSHCGLGLSAANPVLDGLKKFRPVFDKRMQHQDFAPAFDLDRALARARQVTGRDDAAAHLQGE